METKEIITMIVEILIGLSLLIGAIVFIVKWCFDISKRVSKIEDKIDNLPNEIENRIIKQLLPFAILTISNQNNPLSAEEIQLRNKLLKRLQDNSISLSESEKLKDFLETEKEEAQEKSKGELLLAIGIALLAIGLIATAFSKKK